MGTRSPKIHKFLVWAGPALVAAAAAALTLVVSASQTWPRAANWAERQFHAWYPIVTAGWFLMSLVLLVFGYIAALIYTGSARASEDYLSSPVPQFRGSIPRYFFGLVVHDPQTTALIMIAEITNIGDRVSAITNWRAEVDDGTCTKQFVLTHLHEAEGEFSEGVLPLHAGEAIYDVTSHPIPLGATVKGWAIVCLDEHSAMSLKLGTKLALIGNDYLENTVRCETLIAEGDNTIRHIPGMETNVRPARKSV